MQNNNITQYIMYALLALGIVVLVIGLGGDNFDPMFYITYGYFGLGIAAALAGSVMGIMAKPQATKNIAISAAAMVVVYIIAYVLADGSDFMMYNNPNEDVITVTEGMSKFSDTLIYMYYILTIGAIASVIYSGVNKLIR